jgi:hypothetical protein
MPVPFPASWFVSFHNLNLIDMGGIDGLEPLFAVRTFLNKPRPLLCDRFKQAVQDSLPETRTSSLPKRIAIVSSGLNCTRVR